MGPMTPRKPIKGAEVDAALKDRDWLLQALKDRANYLHYNTAKVIQEVIAETGKMDASALDKVKIELMEATWAHGYVMLGSFFFNKLAEIEKEKPAIHAVLTPLFELFCL